MDLFSDFMDRFKKAVGLSKDKEIAELLGLTPTALSERKKRQSIPIKEVLELAKNRPALELDTDWVITGVSKHFETNDRSERHLIECYRLMNDSDKLTMNKIATALSGVNTLPGEEIKLRLAAQEKTSYQGGE